MRVKVWNPIRGSGLLFLAALALGLGSCSGGGGGNNAGNLPSFLALVGVRMGNLNGGAEAATPYPSVPAPGGVTVAPALFLPNQPGSQDFIELTFNIPVLASSIFNPGVAGGAGIAVQKIDNGLITSFPVSLDVAGVLNFANAFPSTSTAPALLKLYVDVDNDITTPETFPAGDYQLTITENLRSFLNGPFCNGPGGPGCVNSVLPVLPFTIGAADSTPIAMASTNPIIPVAGDPAAAINSEVVLNFSEAVDFPTLVGAGNLTALDPFITVPRNIFEPDCNGNGTLIPAFTDAGQLLVVYITPTDPQSGVQGTLPASLRFIVYMPDPITNPTQVRIRFVNGTNLVPIMPGQNYASNPQKFPIQNPNGPGLLALPPIQPVPGSLPGVTGPTDPQAASLNIVVMSPNFSPGNFSFLPPPPNDTCYQATTGVSDRAGNPIANDYGASFTWAAGPPVASNPMPPDATFVGLQAGVPGLAIVNGANSTFAGQGPNTSVPVTYGSPVTAMFSTVANPLQNTAVLGTPLDIEVGAWINTLSPATNNIHNPGRGSINLPGIPDDPNGTTPNGVLDLIGFCPMPCPPLQPWGNFLYVVDGDAGTVKVFNSYNWQLITTLVGIADPRGLGLAPDLSFLYVSNFSQGTVTRIFANPLLQNFNTVSNLITVGPGPTAVAVQGQNLDVFVAEFVGNSYSRISVGTQAVRLSAPAGIGPTEVVVGEQMLCQGLTNAYMAYIYNFFDDTVTVFEEDSPTAPENQPNGRTILQQTGFNAPRHGTWNWQSYIQGSFEPGCFVANSQGSSVDELTMFQFALSPIPGQGGLPGFRTFHILKSYNGFLVGGGQASPSDCTVENMSGNFNVFAVGVSNNKGLVDPIFNGSASVPSLVLVSFPGSGLVGAFDYNSPALFGTVSVPGGDILTSYYDQ